MDGFKLSKNKMERAMGIEPTGTGRKQARLPLTYTRIKKLKLK